MRKHSVQTYEIKFRPTRLPEWTRDDRLRQPVFLGLREDKNANEVVREILQIPDGVGLI